MVKNQTNILPTNSTCSKYYGPGSDLGILRDEERYAFAVCYYTLGVVTLVINSLVCFVMKKRRIYKKNQSFKTMCCLLLSFYSLCPIWMFHYWEYTTVFGVSLVHSSQNVVLDTKHRWILFARYCHVSRTWSFLENILLENVQP